MTSLEALIDGVPARSLQEAALSTTVILPIGGLARLDRAVVDRLPELALSLGGALSITEDYQGGWTGAFGLPSAPSEPVSYLFSAGGGRTWEHRGPLEASIVTRALDGHLAPAERAPFRTLHLGVWTGDPAPDFLFPYQSERRMALRRLRGRAVTLFFWKSWSSACLSELRRMQRLHQRASRQHGIILAVNDGESAERVEAVRRRYGLTLPLVADPRRQISQRYGLIGWPTTVMIDERGIISQIVTGA